MAGSVLVGWCWVRCPKPSGQVWHFTSPSTAFTRLKRPWVSLSFDRMVRVDVWFRVLGFTIRGLGFSGNVWTLSQTLKQGVLRSRRLLPLLYIIPEVLTTSFRIFEMEKLYRNTHLWWEEEGFGAPSVYETPIQLEFNAPPSCVHHVTETLAKGSNALGCVPLWCWSKGLAEDGKR